ncbi:uncharacterized protein MKZ38_010115 [Zalerion maritima]|uniref:Uncharacterized protein n=1 Tax=Zalerion maritima TaxID=339359 RepID=A0AAD5RTT2_9PEZI|nr:uncharacterized protein MKZ38_010115 [Zalerion maritima]
MSSGSHHNKKKYRRRSERTPVTRVPPPKTVNATNSQPYSSAPLPSSYQEQAATSYQHQPAAVCPSAVQSNVEFTNPTPYPYPTGNFSTSQFSSPAPNIVNAAPSQPCFDAFGNEADPTLPLGYIAEPAFNPFPPGGTTGTTTTPSCLLDSANATFYSPLGGTSGQGASYDYGEQMLWSPSTTRLSQPIAPYSLAPPIPTLEEPPRGGRGHVSSSSCLPRGTSLGPSSRRERNQPPPQLLGNDPKKQKQGEGGEKEERERLACPYYLKNPGGAKGACTNEGFRNWYRLKEHFQRRHLDDMRERWTDIKDLGNTTKGFTAKEKWFAAWRILFPGVEPPRDHTRGEMVDREQYGQNVAFLFNSRISPYLYTASGSTHGMIPVEVAKDISQQALRESMRDAPSGYEPHSDAITRSS